MKKSRGILSLILVAAMMVFLGVTALVGLNEKGMGSAKNITLGLDLEGGVSITYQVVGDTPSSTDMSDTIYKLQKRVEQYSTEAQVYQVGDDRISIEIPGVSDANEILSELGQPGSLYFISHYDDDENEVYSYSYTSGEYELNYTIEELEESGAIVLSGSDVADAEAGTTSDSTTSSTEYCVDLELTEEGAELFAEATEEAYNNDNDTIAIYYDGELVSVPSVNAVISDGEAQITGDFTYEEAENLASTIRIGGLSLELEELSSEVVGAQLGQEAISTSLKAGVIGLALVCIFMIIIYLLPGFAAALALLFYTGLMLVCLNAFDVTLTLPGIAGIILGIGMAVDANVIIFARVREEIAAGKGVQTALKEGFRKATSAIVDGNVTTLIAAGVLYLRGSGSVRGFAQTLAMGIVISMFTALVITRLLVYSFYAVGLKSKGLYAKSLKTRKVVDFVGKKKIFFIISIVLCLSGPVFMGINYAQGNGILNFSLEFVGGTSTTVTFNEEYTLDEVDELMIADLEDITGDSNIQVQVVQGTTEVTFKTQTQDLDTREAFNEYMLENYGVEESSIATENISSTVSSEMRQDAVVAVILATICMLLYIWLRFKDIRFATSAVIALVHDVLVVLAFYSIFRVSVGNTFIACMLTIVGYSINGTIVIFDRIREELPGQTRLESLQHLVNRCITNTLTRSIYTNLTTFVMIAVLYILGVSSIREFAAPLMVGVICGTYSSVCVTGGLWYVMKTKIGSKRVIDVPEGTKAVTAKAGAGAAASGAANTGAAATGEAKASAQSSGKAGADTGEASNGKADAQTAGNSAEAQNTAAKKAKKGKKKSFKSKKKR